MLQNAVRFTLICETAGVPMRPKLHLLLHIPLRALQEGRPALHATWADETLNRVVALLGNVAHSRVWEQRVLASFEQHISAQRPSKAARI